MIQSYNEKAAATWDSGGPDYDRISQTISDAIEHCVTRLVPKPAERILDVATGTGWAARRIAARLSRDHWHPQIVHPIRAASLS